MKMDKIALGVCSKKGNNMCDANRVRFVHTLCMGERAGKRRSGE